MLRPQQKVAEENETTKRIKRRKKTSKQEGSEEDEVEEHAEENATFTPADFLGFQDGADIGAYYEKESGQPRRVYTGNGLRAAWLDLLCSAAPDTTSLTLETSDCSRSLD